MQNITLRQSAAIWNFAFRPLIVATAVCILSSPFLAPFLLPTSSVDVVIFLAGIFLSFRRWEPALNRTYKRFKVTIDPLDEENTTIELEGARAKILWRTWLKIFLATLILSLVLACVVGPASFLIISYLIPFGTPFGGFGFVLFFLPMLFFATYFAAFLASQMLIGSLLTRDEVRKMAMGTLGLIVVKTDS